MEKITVNNWSLVKPEELEGHWITGEEIGRHLGYSEPRISISNLYNRYKESFQEGLDCSVIKLITEAGARDVRAFSRRGVLKVIRHSNTAVADKVMDEVFDVYLAVRAKAKAQAVTSMALLPTPEQEATSIMSAWLKAAQLLEVPKYYAQAEAVKATHTKTGIDYSPLLLKAPAQDNVPEAEMFLEVTEIGELLGFEGKGKRKGAEVNKFLGEQGFIPRSTPGRAIRRRGLTSNGMSDSLEPYGRRTKLKRKSRRQIKSVNRILIQFSAFWSGAPLAIFFRYIPFPNPDFLAKYQSSQFHSYPTDTQTALLVAGPSHNRSTFPAGRSYSGMPGSYILHEA
jgi:prophage antirepressor-like protein